MLAGPSAVARLTAPTAREGMMAAPRPRATSVAAPQDAAPQDAAPQDAAPKPAAPQEAAEGDQGSAAQRDRRKRILDATLALACQGGYDAVQMRAVAEQADVALGTLYRYFPSKVHLLVSGLIRELERTSERLDRTPIPGDTPYQRMLYVLGRITRIMQREPMLTEAMTRAIMSADPSATAEVNAVSRLMEHMLTSAMHEGEPSSDDRAIARVIGDVWLSNLVSWVTRRASTDDVSGQLEVAARLLLR
jgi:TetR/AcrR family transcriptional regulator, cholesterol catabolism regulator